MKQHRATWCLLLVALLLSGLLAGCNPANATVKPVRTPGNLADEVRELGRIADELDAIIADTQGLREALDADIPSTMRLFQKVEADPYAGCIALAADLDRRTKQVQRDNTPLTFSRTARVARTAQDLALFVEQLEVRMSYLDKQLQSRADMFAAFEPYRALELSEGISSDIVGESTALADLEGEIQRIHATGNALRTRSLLDIVTTMKDVQASYETVRYDALKQASKGQEYRNLQRDIEAWFRDTNAQYGELFDAMLADIQSGAAFVADAHSRIASISVTTTPAPDDARVQDALEIEAGDAQAMGRQGFPAQLIANLQYPEELFPGYYESYPAPFSLVLMSARPVDCIVELEVTGMTRKMEQLVTVGHEPTVLEMRPPLVQSLLQQAPAAFGAQIVVTVRRRSDNGTLAIITNDVLVHALTELSLTSKYRLHDNADALAAYVTPEEPIIRRWHRLTIERMEEMTDYQLAGLYGYQRIGDYTMQECVRLQIDALFQTLFFDYGVRYNSAVFSASEGANGIIQRVSLPRMVIEESSGVCLDTTLAMASALEALDMNVYLLQMPGHTLLMVESGMGTGDYFSVETTMLTEKLLADAIELVPAESLGAYLVENDVSRVVDLRWCRARGIRALSADW